MYQTAKEKSNYWHIAEIIGNGESGSICMTNEWQMDQEFISLGENRRQSIAWQFNI
jgi:hypothetical protein